MEYIQGTLFGKMSPEHSAAMTDATFPPSLANSQGSSTQPLQMCLVLKTDGLKRESYWCPTGRLLGDLMTRNFGECPNDVRESHLSQILEDRPHTRYFLSSTAAIGILKRANSRGKQLPERLEKALYYQSGLRRNTYGGKKGILIKTDRVGAIRPMKNQAVCYNISPYESNAMLSKNPDAGIQQIDTTRTLDNNGGNPSCNQGGTLIVDDPAVFDSQPHHGCREFSDGICHTVNAEYGTGGNNQALVVATMQGFGDYTETDVASSCKQRDYKDATDLVCRVDSEVYGESSFGTYSASATSSQACGGTAGPGSENLVTAHTAQPNALQEKYQYVRRLTPMECERLQGFPDNWTNIPGASDSARYRALGNSIALPFWEHLAKRFVQIGNVKTIGSLFAGIGGFELCFLRSGVKTLWTSEIELFCQRVVAYHFDENGDLKEHDLSD